MKKLSSIVIFLFSINILAQNISIDLKYSGLISGSNNESASLYSLGGNYEFLNSDIILGISVGVLDATVLKNFITHSPPRNVHETSTILGIDGKYFPGFLRAGSHIFKPYLGIDLGLYLYQITFGISGNLLTCEESFHFSSNKYFYLNLSIGSIIFPDEPLSIIFETKYQIRNPKITYQKPNCFADKTTIYTEFRETVNLNMLLWSIGVQVKL